MGESPLRAGAERLAGRVDRGWVACALAILVHGAYALHRGVVIAPDTHTYSRWGDELIAAGFSIPEFLASSPTGGTRVFYVGFVSVVAALKLLAGDAWPAALAALNAVCSGITCALVVGLARRITRSGLAALTALALYLLAFEVFGWVPYALSDVTFLALGFGTFALAAALVLSDEPRRARRLAIAVCAAFPVVLLFRPTGLVLLPALALAGTMRLSARRSGRPAVAAMLATFLVGVAIAVPLNALVVQDPSRWPTERLADAIRVQSGEYSAGQIVRDRPETYHSAPDDLLDYVLVTADRFRHFFRFTMDAFSRSHNLFNVAFFVPVYLLVVATLVRLAAGRLPVGPRERDVVLLSVVVVFSYAVFHSLTQIDYDWRYRVPVIPHLVLLAAVAVAGRGGARERSGTTLP